MYDEAIDIEARKKKTIKIAIILAAIAFAAIVIYAAIVLISRIGKVKVNIVYAPYASTVKLNGNTVRNNADNYIAPGKYTLTADFNNFQSIEEEVEINESTKSLFGALTAINDEGKQYGIAHEHEFTAVSGLIGQKVSDYGQSLHDKYPLMATIAYKDPHYDISYEITDNEEFKIIIKSNLSYRDLAINKLMTRISADDLVKYDVEIKEIESPFASATFTENAETDPQKYLQTGYGAAMDGFYFGQSRKKDGYYYGFIRRDVGYVGDVYRYILKSADDGWKLCGTPYPVLTAKNTALISVPGDILYGANTDDYETSVRR